MAEWLYKATTTKATLPATLNLALIDNFIARSAYEFQNHSKADNVWDVVMGDVLHLYYREKGRPLVPLGSYEVTLPPDGSSRFGEVIPGTALVRVIDPALNASGAAFPAHPTRWIRSSARCSVGSSSVARTSYSPPAPSTCCSVSRRSSRTRRTCGIGHVCLRRGAHRRSEPGHAKPAVPAHAW